MTEAEFLDLYVDKIVEVLQAILRHDSIAPPNSNDNIELKMRAAMVASIGNLNRWQAIQSGADGGDFKEAACVGISCSLEFRRSMEELFKVADNWINNHQRTCSYCNLSDRDSAVPPIF